MIIDKDGNEITTFEIFPAKNTSSYWNVRYLYNKVVVHKKLFSNKIITMTTEITAIYSKHDLFLEFFTKERAKEFIDEEIKAYAQFHQDILDTAEHQKVPPEKYP